MMSSNFNQERGLVGITNTGNTCFMSSVIQCLSNTRPLLEYILREEFLRDVESNNYDLLKRFAELIQNMWNEHRQYAVNANGLKVAMTQYTNRFIGNNQHDAQEFLRILLESVHKEINQIRGHQRRGSPDRCSERSLSAEETWQTYLRSDNSRIVSIFGGLLKSVLTCKTCKFSSTVYEPFWDLSLPIPTTGNYDHNSLTLNACLIFFTKEETLDATEKATCSKCKSKQICTKRILIQKFPQVLVIHLKRFSGNVWTQKIENCVEFPIEGLDMSEFAAEAGTLHRRYNLYAVVSHCGSIQFGHYTAYCKHPYSGRWYHFNDKHVTALLNKDSTDKKSAYILFYEAVL